LRTLSYTKTGEKLIWQKFELEVIDMDGVKIDKVMVKALKCKNSFQLQFSI
jgi:CBS domain containing-hemolysin-like protein